MESLSKINKADFREGYHRKTMGVRSFRKLDIDDRVLMDDLIKEVEECWKKFWTHPKRINLKQNPLITARNMNE